MSNDAFQKLEDAIKAFDKYYKYSDDPRVWNLGNRKSTEILQLFQAAAAIDEEKAKALYKKLMDQDPPKTAKEIQAKIKSSEEKTLKDVLDQIQNRINWSNEKHEQNRQPAAFICGMFRTLGDEARKVINNEINRSSHGRYPNHKSFCMNLFQKVFKGK